MQSTTNDPPLSNVFVDDEPISNTKEISPFVRKLVKFLDSGYTLPGTNYQVGVDGLIGLIPAIGDFAGVLIGMVVVGEGVRLKVPKFVLMKMIGNLIMDGAVGSVPVAGDLFDFMFKAHQRNLALLEKHLEEEKLKQV